MLACQLAQNLAGTDNKSLQQHQACLFFWPSCLARAASQRRATITQAGTGGRYQAVQAFCICSAAADVLALVSCRTSSARHLFCLLRIGLDNLCADTRVICWCPNNRMHNGKQQHAKNGATQLHDNTMGSPAGASQLEFKLLNWNCRLCALLANKHRKCCETLVIHALAGQQQNPLHITH